MSTHLKTHCVYIILKYRSSVARGYQQSNNGLNEGRTGISCGVACHQMEPLCSKILSFVFQKFPVR